MRARAICLASAAAITAGCLRSTEFKCLQDADCGASGTCEPIGYCSVPDTSCPATGRSFGDSAGQGLASTCVPAGGGDGMSAGCPADYVAVAGSKHRYKRIATASWVQAKAACEQAGAAAYLLVPDDAAELGALAAITSPPFWIGIDDQTAKGTFMTARNVPATFLPWATGEPSRRSGMDCVRASSASQIATDLCSARHAAICECEP
jgi:hypothetical protein